MLKSRKAAIILLAALSMVEVNGYNTARVECVHAEEKDSYEITHGILPYKYPEEFVLTDNLKGAISELASYSAKFDNAKIDNKSWKEYFIARFITNSRYTFDYLDKLSGEKEAKITAGDIIYINKSLTDTEIDFTDVVKDYVDVSNASSFMNSGKIISYKLVSEDSENVTISGIIRFTYDGTDKKVKEKFKATLVRNPYSCFDGYSIKSLTTSNLRKSSLKEQKLSFDFLGKTYGVAIKLPKECRVKSSSEEYMPLIGPDTKIVRIYHKKYAALGLDAFGEKADGTDISDTDPNRLMEIYSGIALGNDYHFDIKNTYKKVCGNGTSEAGVCEVYRSPSLTGGKEQRHIGIVYYNNDSKMIFAMELNRKYSNKTAMKTAKKIAKSIKMVEE